MDHQQNLLVKNTFIDISTETDNDSLPRAFSDQSHARNRASQPPALASTISPIKEEGSDSLSDPTSSESVVSGFDLHTLRTVSRPDTTNAGIPVSFMNFPMPSLFSFLPTFDASSLPPISACRWHEQSSTMGELTEDNKVFTKQEFDGRLSMVSNDTVFESGVHRFLVLIESGSLSVADGFGFVFSNTLPCKKNIQKIESIFVSKKGKICSRIHNELEILNDRSIGSIDVGSVVELVVDLDSLTASFALYSPPGSIDPETLSILAREEKNLSHWQIGTWQCSIANIVAQTNQPTGHFCAVLKNKNTKIRFL